MNGDSFLAGETLALARRRAEEKGPGGLRPAPLALAVQWLGPLYQPQLIVIFSKRTVTTPFALVLRWSTP
jgi:hypothetical protein